VSWRPLTVGLLTDSITIGGLAVWAEQWRPTGERLSLPHPAYPEQMHDYSVYEIGPASSAVRFAAGELSNGVWGFYVPA
jgi:hypothetical protein